MESRALGFVLLTFLKASAWSYGSLPRPVRAIWERALSGLLRALGFRREVMERNLELAFPGLGQETKRRELQSAAYSHIGKLFLEILLLFGPFKRHCQKVGDVRGVENWRAASAQGRGVLMLSSHVGNWEVMAGAGALRGIDILLVTKRLKPGWLHDAIEKGRATCGVEATYEPRTMRDVLARLRKGGTVGFVLDQYSGPPVGVRVPYFGVPVGTNLALATLARRTGAVVLPVVNFRTPDGLVRVDIGEPLAWIPAENPDYELAVNTAHYVRVVEEHVRAHPDQWLWTHQRFKGDLSPLREGEWASGRARS